MKFKCTLSYALFFLVTLAFLSLPSCKNDDKEPAIPTPAMTSIAPASGIAGTTVVINGINFSETILTNVVTFNGKPTPVTEASLTQLTVSVPLAAGTGPVTVQVGNQRSNEVTFTYIVSDIAGTLAGNKKPGYVDGNDTTARFKIPLGVAVDKQGNVYVADRDNQVIRKITAAGVVTTLAGNASKEAGYAEGTGTNARFNAPAGLAVDATGHVYVAEFSGHRIRKITPDGLVSTLAGNGSPGFVQATGAAAQFNKPAGIAIDKDGSLFIADIGNNCIRKVSQAGAVTLFAGSGIAGTNSGPVEKAEFNYPISVAVDANGLVYVAEANNNRISKIEKK